MALYALALLFFQPPATASLLAICMLPGTFFPTGTQPGGSATTVTLEAL